MSPQKNQCCGITRNLHRCGRIGDWRFFCHEHSRQWLLWLSFFIFTVIAGSISIISKIPIIDYLKADKVVVEGPNNIEKTFIQAKMESAYYDETHSTFLLGKLYVRPIFEFIDTKNNDSHFAVTSISKFKPLGSNYIFRADECRFLGKASSFDPIQKTGTLYIYLGACGNQEGPTYSLDARKMENVDAIGYVSLPGMSGKENIPLIRENGIHTLPMDTNVEIFLYPETNIFTRLY